MEPHSGIILKVNSGFARRIRANVTEKDLYGKTLLHHVCENPNFSSVKLSENLIKKGINLNEKDNIGKTALHYACASTSTSIDEVIELLINSGIDLDTKDNKGKTPIDYCNCESVRKLIIDAKNATNTSIKLPSIELKACVNIDKKTSISPDASPVNITNKGILKK